MGWTHNLDGEENKNAYITLVRKYLGRPRGRW